MSACKQVFWLRGHPPAHLSADRLVCSGIWAIVTRYSGATARDLAQEPHPLPYSPPALAGGTFTHVPLLIVGVNYNNDYLWWFSPSSQHFFQNRYPTDLVGCYSWGLSHTGKLRCPRAASAGTEMGPQGLPYPSHSTKVRDRRTSRVQLSLKSSSMRISLYEPPFLLCRWVAPLLHEGGNR